MKSWSSKGDTALSVQQYRRKISHSMSTMNTVVERVVAGLCVDSCVPTITPESLAVLSLMKKPKSLPITYETPLLPGLLDVKSSPPVAQKGNVLLQGDVLDETHLLTGWDKMGWINQDLVGLIYEHAAMQNKINEMHQQQMIYGAAFTPYTHIEVDDPPYNQGGVLEMASFELPPSPPGPPAPTDAQKLAAAEALEKAADLLLFKGWVRGKLYEYDKTTSELQKEEMKQKAYKHNKNQLKMIYENKKNKPSWYASEFLSPMEFMSTDTYHKVEVQDDGTTMSYAIPVPDSISYPEFHEWSEKYLD